MGTLRLWCYAAGEAATRGAPVVPASPEPSPLSSPAAASSALASWHSCRACSLDSAVKCGHQLKRDIPKEEEPDTHGLVSIQFTDKLGRRENANLKRLFNLDTVTADFPIEG